MSYYRSQSTSGSLNNILLNDKRSRMLNYSNHVTNKNLGMNYYYETNYHYKDKFIHDNLNEYSNKINDNKKIVNIYNYRDKNATNLFNTNKRNSFLNNDNNTNIYKRDEPLFRNNNHYNNKQNNYDSKYSITNNKYNLKPKTEITKEKYPLNYNFLENKGYFDINNNYINNYIPNLDRKINQNYNTKEKESFFNKELNELEKGNNKKQSNLNEISNKKEYDMSNTDKLINKYKKEDNEKYKIDIGGSKNKIIMNNIEKNNEILINGNRTKIEEKKELEKLYNFSEKNEDKISTSHNNSKMNRSKSLDPSKNMAISENSKILNSLIGFNNLGATCYMNSALQNLIHCKIFIEKIAILKNPNIINIQDKSITNSFLNLCNSLIDSRNKETRTYLRYISSLNSISPSNFKSNFCLKHKEYMRGQHDSIEFLRTLLDDLSKEINVNQNISAYKELTTQGKSKEEQSKEYHNFFISRENSIIVDIFYNQIINIFTCSCGFESYSFQKLLDIPLLLPNKKSSIDLSSLINEYFKEEELDWSSKCENCLKPELKHLKITKFCILNEIVIFSLQRFDPVLSIKNNIRVSFDEIIDLKEYCDLDLFKQNTKYRLCGTINHIGNINYGHYYTYVRIGEIWYEFNDSLVQKVYKMDYENSSVCVLFYEKL